MTAPDDPVTRSVALLGDAAPMPCHDGEPVFGEPWEGRAFAMALDVLDRSGRPWEEFRTRLVAAIAEDQRRPYYASWVVALERLVVETTAVTTADLDRARNGAASYRYDEAGLGEIEVFPIRPDPAVLFDVLRDAFGGSWWRDLRVLPGGAGATVRRLHRPATVSAVDGLVTIDAGGGDPELHVELGAPGGSRRRACRHAELYRRWSLGAPRSWGLRLFDGDGDVQIDVLLPDPLTDAAGRPLRTPDWSRLSCWDHLRRRALDLGPDPADRGAATPTRR